MDKTQTDPIAVINGAYQEAYACLLSGNPSKWDEFGVVIVTALEAAGWEIRKKSENERLRKALSFYAESWEGHAGDSGPGGNWPADADCWPDDYLIEDCGERARQALACSPTYSQGKVWFELGLRVKCNKCGRKAEGILHPFNTPLCRPCGQDALKDQATSQGGDDG